LVERLLLLAKRETGTARLEAALAAFRAALTERTRERMPIQWARSTANEGDALLVLAERLSDAGLAQQAVYQLEQATEAIPDSSYNDTDWVYYRARLLKARALLEQLKPVRMVGKIARWFGFQAFEPTLSAKVRHRAGAKYLRHAVVKTLE
jgi:tetratricopeptide (TPR) repeat protein